MSPIGEQLRAAREAKGLTLDRVADETNIAKRYLAALEDEEFSVFPGEPYILGFLRNYADYLGLPANELATAYKNMKIQEEPVPIQELIPRRGPSPLAIVGIAVGSAALGIAALLLFLRPGAGAEEEAAAARPPVEYRIEGGSFEKRLYVGDSVVATAGGEKYRLAVSRIDDAVTVEGPSGPARLLLGEEGALDLNKDNKPELLVMVTDLSKKESSKGAVLRLEYPSSDATLIAAADAPAAETGAAEGSTPAPAPAPAQAPIATVVAPQPAEPAGASQPSKSAVIFESGKSPYPFVVSVTFRGPCLFRYEKDKTDRSEAYYRKGENITVNANNSVRIWASNALNAKVTIQASGGKSADLDLGAAGEVAVKRIAWSQTDAGTWNLSAADVD